MKRPFTGSQDGQAATEFLIAAAFILIPLFLIVPLLGKYIDIKHAAIQQARFTAWEYTVWTGEDERTMAGIDAAQSAGLRKHKDIIEQGIGYFFTDPSDPSYGTPSNRIAINPLWKDQRQVPLLALADVSSDIDERDTPVPAGLIGQMAQKLFQFVGDVLSLFGQLLRWAGVDAQFDAIHTDGYFVSKVNATVRSLDQALPPSSFSGKDPGGLGAPLVFTAKAAVLSDNWNAGSTKNATAESRGLVITALLAPITDKVDYFIRKINGLLHKIPLVKIKLPGVPQFGKVEDDLIPFEHLEGNKKKLESKSGLYSYE